MNEEIESFEKRLKRPPLRQIPPEWREGILRAADETQSIRQVATAREYSFLSNFYRRLASMLWPHPVAWAGLAAVWIFAFAVNYSIRESQPVVAEKVAVPSQDVIAELRQQERLYVELTGVNDSNDADRQKAFVPRPRSELVKLLAA